MRHELVPLRRAFNALIRTAPSKTASAALREGIRVLVAAPITRPLARPVIQAPHWAFGNGAAPGRIAQLKAAPAADWESTRLKLHAIYRAATGEERLAIAAELGIAGSTLRNIISSSAPGKAVSNRVAQWLVGREGGVRESSAPNSDTGIPISPTPNGADSSHAHYLSADQRERLSFLIASDPTAVRQSGVRISLARHAADGGEIEPATAARLVNFLSA